MKLLPTSFLRIVSFLPILFIVATGCATKQAYPGPQLPPEKAAKLKGTYHYYLVADVECIIVNVDGRSIYGGQWSSGNTVEMLPGKHEVTIKLIYGVIGEVKNGQSQTFSFVAEAGHVYKADGNWHGGDNQIWIIDEKTGQAVAGMKPLPHEKVARLKGRGLFNSPLCGIEAVDEKIMSDFFTMEAEMLPGKHEVTIKLIEPILGFQKWRFSFVAEAGHVYQVDANWKGDDVQIWIIDRETGQVVAGEKP